MDDKKDEVVYNLIEELEIEGNNTRGYVQDKVKERLKAFDMLCKKIGTNDPMEVVMKYVEAVSSTGTYSQPSDNEREEAASVEDDDTSALDAFVNAKNNSFNF